ncbi:MAG TPA: response regulator transcription factor [Candidatus Acidoferrum sp.]|nr:response regulator transcription factor [Candidatus Acidoferrum sp.]
MRILVVEDDVELADFLLRGLQQEHFLVEIAVEVKKAQRMLSDQLYDLVVLDLPRQAECDMDILRRIRAEKPNLPVVIVTEGKLAEEHVRWLNAGADDFLAKPLDCAELAARIRAVLRRASRPACAVLKVDDLEVDRVTHTVSRASKSIELSPKEFGLLEFLMQHAGHPITRSAIVEHVWKLRLEPMTNVVDVYINYLRRKIDARCERPLIRTIRGVGYQIGGEPVPGNGSRF